MRIERRSMAPQVEGRKIRLKIPYNSTSTDMGFREVIAPGAFKRTLSDPNAEVLGFWNHNSDMVLGRRSAGTLSLDDDEEGLLAELEEDETSWSADARAAIRSGNVRGASFGFIVAPNGDSWDRSGGEWMRTLNDCDLLELSPVAQPAYGESEADLS
jgi:HK97 family phage prohead protease